MAMAGFAPVGPAKVFALYSAGIRSRKLAARIAFADSEQTGGINENFLFNTMALGLPPSPPIGKPYLCHHKSVFQKKRFRD